MKSSFTKNTSTSYDIRSFNGNVSIIEFRIAFQTPFIKFVFGENVNLYEMYFENTLTVSNSVDPWMFTIVETILVDFMTTNYQDLVYYSISRMDGRNDQLFRLYSIWFKKICINCIWLAKVDKILLEQNKIVDHISCMYNLKYYSNIDMDQTCLNILTELYPQCLIQSPS